MLPNPFSGSSGSDSTAESDASGSESSFFDRVREGAENAADKVKDTVEGVAEGTDEVTDRATDAVGAGSSGSGDESSTDSSSGGSSGGSGYDYNLGSGGGGMDQQSPPARPPSSGGNGSEPLQVDLSPSNNDPTGINQESAGMVQIERAKEVRNMSARQKLQREANAVRGAGEDFRTTVEEQTNQVLESGEDKADNLKNRAGGIASTARDVVFEGHEGDEISTADLYEASGANTIVDIAFQDAEEVEAALGIEENRRGDSTNLSGPAVNIGNIGSDGPVLESGESGDLNTDVTDALTDQSGFLSSNQRSELREDIQQRKETFGVGEEADRFVTNLTGSEKAGNFAGGVGDIPGDAASATAGLTLAADTGFQAARNAPETVDEYGAGAVAYNVLETGGRATEATVQGAKSNPYGFAGSLTGSIVGGAAASKAIGASTRYTRDRVRTAGGTEVDLEDITQEDVVRNVETDGAEGDRFPGAADPDLYESDPSEAVRQQAAEKTPESIDDRFADAGVEEGTVLKKALDTEPEGPGKGRASQGFESAPGESLEDFDYETPGSFVGPELSPNFLRASGQSSSMSLSLGLPDTGNKPTGVLAKTEVKNPDSDTLDEFNKEMIERSGETTARTKPAADVNAGEVEAIIPPGSKFDDIGGSRVRNALRQVGVGSDFYTKVAGRRVPLRPVAPSGRSKSPSGGDVEADGGMADTSGVFSDKTLSEIERPVGDPTDDVIPVPPSTPQSNPETLDETTSAAPSDSIIGDSSPGGSTGGMGDDSQGSGSTGPSSSAPDSPPSSPPGSPSSSSPDSPLSSPPGSPASSSPDSPLSNSPGSPASSSPGSPSPPWNPGGSQQHRRIDFPELESDVEEDVVLPGYEYETARIVRELPDPGLFDSDDSPDSSDGQGADNSESDDGVEAIDDTDEYDVVDTSDDYEVVDDGWLSAGDGEPSEATTDGVDEAAASSSPGASESTQATLPRSSAAQATVQASLEDELDDLDTQLDRELEEDELSSQPSRSGSQRSQPHGWGGSDPMDLSGIDPAPDSFDDLDVGGQHSTGWGRVPALDRIDDEIDDLDPDLDGLDDIDDSLDDLHADLDPLGDL
ncbi:hypothetical protein SAMN06269185_3331 [Natronoarchaeum philippinense]|uniref:Uncharacterized protein n=2 Tax=Natronoarchaeum philippinense TaxID=558529 RepID=A0A285P9C8_NATPI|nr:hypothetical protein SAMN06269185_3331 [Natronoarchaeum philippinense]